MPATRNERILGALLGVHAGDSLGATLEFKPWTDIHRLYPDGVRDIIGGGPFDWPAGHATDDTDMTRAVLLAYKDDSSVDAIRTTAATASHTSSVSIAHTAGNYMLDWYDGRWPGRRLGSRPPDVGNTTRAGLSKFKRTRDARKAGAGQGQAGNGSLMRCIPTALFAEKMDVGDTFSDQYLHLLEETALISAITHNDWRCVLACVAYNVMARELVDGVSPDTAVAAGIRVLHDDRAVEAVISCLAVPLPATPSTSRQGQATSTSVSDLCEARQQVQNAIEQGKRVQVHELAALGPKEAPGGLAAIPHKAGGYVLESLTLAVAAVLDTSRSLEDLLVDVVRIGHDTDTNAAIAGGLLGARDGADSIPVLWRSKLQFAKEFTEIVD